MKFISIGYGNMVAVERVVALVSPVQPENALAPMEVPPVMTTVFSEAGT